MDYTVSKNIWVISDTHFNHENILKFTDRDGFIIRPFASVQQMDEHMVQKWNSVVKPGDKVYHLGDVFFGSKEYFKKLWPRLNGSKNLIVGNHDDIKFMSNGGFFKKVYMWRKLPEFNMLLTHVPVHDSVLGESRFNKQPYNNIHGHIYQNKSPSDRHVCVSVEQIGYTPINMEELRDDYTR